MRDRGRALGGLDEHLDRAVAAEPEPPHLVVVGGEVPAGEAGRAFLHHDARQIGDVAFQAAAADVADGRALLRHQQTGPRPAVGRPAHRDDRRQRHPSPLRAEALDCLQDVGDLAHASMVVRRPRFRSTQRRAMEADTGLGMDDSFSFGGRKKHRSSVRPRRPRRSEPDPPPKHAASRRTVSIDGRRIAFGAIGLVLAAASIWGFLHLDGERHVRGSGREPVHRPAPPKMSRRSRRPPRRCVTVQSLYDSKGSFATVTPRELRATGSAAGYSAPGLDRRGHGERRIDGRGRRHRRPVVVGNVLLCARHPLRHHVRNGIALHGRGRAQGHRPGLAEPIDLIRRTTPARRASDTSPGWMRPSVW